MKEEIIQQHLHSILSNISSIAPRIETLSYEDFRKEEMVRDEVYSELQEIGTTANELINNTEDLDIQQELVMLSKLKNATYNENMEINHQQVWNLMQTYLPPIAQTIEQSKHYI